MTDNDGGATKAVAEATKEGIIAGREFGGFFNRIFGPALEEYGKALKDRASVYRYENALKLRDRMERIHTERGIREPVPIPARQAIPFFEAATLEDDDELQEALAHLAANATDPERRLNLKRVYTDILKQMEPLDWLLLQRFEKVGVWLPQSDKPGKEIPISVVAGALKTSNEEALSSLQNLGRLGCVRFDQPGSFMLLADSESDNSPAIVSRYGEFHLAALGVELVEACK
jgi:Abortive infection alpha